MREPSSKLFPWFSLPIVDDRANAILRQKLIELQQVIVAWFNPHMVQAGS
ncbi:MULTISPECIES: hypothetical protein [unclassified Microcoleus]|nr:MULTISPECIES: hypothetical protein [unclassified Microcoleus]